MKLLNCHIENFGKLHDFDTDFAPDWHVVCEENGFGKSTLAAFLRIMFYGFLGEAKRNGVENERKRFKPWQGGAYGGTVAFETGGKQYRLTRIFANKAQNDEFELRDLHTNLPSADFSDRIGEELFSVNQESFLRTVFIGQNDLITNATDDIQAKIGNLTDNTNDLNSFEDADKRLTDYINGLSPHRKTGAVYKLKESETALLTKIRALDGIGDAILKQQEYLYEANTETEALKASMEEIARAQSVLSRQQDALSQKTLYEHLCEEEKDKETKLRELEREYQDNLPKREEWNEICAKQNEAETILLHIQNAALTKQEQERLEVLRSRYPDREHDREEAEELTRLWNEANIKKSTIVMKEAQYSSMLRQWEQEAKKQSLVLPAGSFFLMLAGLVTLIYYVGIALLAAGIVLLVIWLKRRKEMSEQKMPVELQNLKSDLEKDRELIRTAEERIRTYLKEKQKDGREETVSEGMREISSELEEQRHLEEKAKKADRENENMDRYDRLSEEVGVFLLRYEIDAAPDTYRDALDALKERMTSAHTLRNNKREDLDAARKRRERFESEHDMEAILQQLPKEGDTNLNDLNISYKNKAEKIEELRQKTAEYSRRLDAMREQSDTLEEMQQQLTDLRQRIQEQTELYDRLKLVQELMRQAKETLTQKYVAPLKMSFERYYQIMMKGQSAASHYMDANARITVEEQGMQRETEYLSAGYRDLIGLCLRLSFADAMYPDEKPMLILDDPLVNLDEDKASGGLSLLEEAAKKYQIIYFTCHGSRCYNARRQ